mmetsp:Transcript_59301/g.152685  ORF Transcript_59301/g.152685 Transcript_59301/m.152685 type:complete len:574 (-) Transcript_59301:80-1801(-)|eukprot:CAMPEP_0195065030 /NCGR_PEP_ID=MMETSP0448-20130528/10809_1 /TAXON_ID=66468 /ORGANISM="Heterocapsa triquestra, Strain CCMP 448" /LENGTH=573 /DNA_ID=CAMNT_0040096083 /DNA_START=69 /DNA_END=1790 /DNA_ORIENTATION=-
MAGEAGRTAQPNFYLWGQWKSRQITEPFLTKKVAAPLKKIVLGDSFIIGLTEQGKVVSWGKDAKHGCLGLGSDPQTNQKIVNRDAPQEVELQNVKDIQMGKNHVVALTSIGEVYCWGNGELGQLGNGALGCEFKPTKVDSLASEQIVQIAVLENSTFALSTSGVVYAWGCNKAKVLLEDASVDMVRQPKRLARLGEVRVRKLEVFENRTMIAHLANNEGEDGFNDFGPGLDDEQDAETEVFKGIDEMRKTMEKTQEWWNHMLNIKHGQPYDTPVDNISNPARLDNNGVEVGTIQHDQGVDPRELHRAEAHLERLINVAVEELRRTRMPGTKNVRFILCMFIDECRLRREKVQRTISARLLTDSKKKTQEINAYSVTDFGANANEEIRKIIAVTKRLQEILNDVKTIEPVDVLSQELKVTLMECLECKLQLHDTRVELLKAAGGRESDPMLPALRIIKDRWNSLKNFSLYSLYHDVETSRKEFPSEDEHLEYLVKTSNRKIDQILQVDKDRIISHDTIVPALCYDLLRENAELRKMTNSYQLTVLMLYHGKKPSGAHVGLKPVGTDGTSAIADG